MNMADLTFSGSKKRPTPLLSGRAADAQRRLGAEPAAGVLRPSGRMNGPGCKLSPFAYDFHPVQS